MVVVDKDGMQGMVDEAANLAATSPDSVLVRFQNGQQVIVPRALLTHHADGRYHLQVSVNEFIASQEGNSHVEATKFASASVNDMETSAETLVIPVVQETVKVQTQVIESGVVEIRKRIHERVETVDQPLRHEEVQVERVPVNRFVEAPVPVRHDGDTMIISLLEEVLVVEKRLLLREEVHVKKLQREVHEPQEVLLREEQVEVVRKAGTSPAEQQSTTRQ